LRGGYCRQEKLVEVVVTSFNFERRVGGPVESAVSPMKLSIEDHRSRRQFVRFRRFEGPVKGFWRCFGTETVRMCRCATRVDPRALMPPRGMKLASLSRAFLPSSVRLMCLGRGPV
ncbi:LOW QUALITY PROTEIN: hypothetical protein HID58_054449, partial [Brassica napus]